MLENKFSIIPCAGVECVELRKLWPGASAQVKAMGIYTYGRFHNEFCQKDLSRDLTIDKTEASRKTKFLWAKGWIFPVAPRGPRASNGTLRYSPTGQLYNLSPPQLLEMVKLLARMSSDWNDYKFPSEGSTL